MTSDDCRKAFEEWAKDKQEDLYGLEWSAWQAAYNAKPSDLTGCQREWLDPELKGAEDKRREQEGLV
jgi:hypothetical protein